MSKSSQSPIDCSSPSSPDITAIALKLQEAAQALLAIGAPGGSGRFSEPFFNACSIYENQSDDSLEDDEDDTEEDACCGGGKAKT